MANVTVSPQQSPDTSLSKVVNLAIDPIKVGGAGTTYDLGTVAGGAIQIISATPYVGTAVTGLTTLAIQTNNTVPIVILAATAAAVLTIDLSITPYTTKTYMASGKKIQYTVVGTGTAGTMFLSVEYRPLTSGATLS